MAGGVLGDCDDVEVAHELGGERGAHYAIVVGDQQGGANVAVCFCVHGVCVHGVCQRGVGEGSALGPVKLSAFPVHGPGDPAVEGFHGLVEPASEPVEQLVGGAEVACLCGHLEL